MEPFSVDPRFITSSDWFNVARLVQYLWIVVIINICVAFFMLLAHAVIPSLIATAEIPRGVRAMRPVFTIIAMAAFAGTVFVLLNWLGTLGVLYSIYPHRLV